MHLSPESVTFCLLSFEGPDRYALAGGLGVRITNLAETLARRGFEVHLFFVGDPSAPGVEPRENLPLTYHRWCQWISRFYPLGVYDGEEDKLRDFEASLPPYLIETILRPALKQGRIPVVLAEEWHTVGTVIRLQDELHRAGIGDRCVVFWNANNTMSFHRVDWPRLTGAAQVTTVSRYMKHVMWGLGVNPYVIPNGIPADLLAPVDGAAVRAVRKALDPADDGIVLFKIGRFDPAKRWLMAVDAAAAIRAGGRRIAFPISGGLEPHGYEVFDRARSHGLTIADIDGAPESWQEVVSLIEHAPPSDIYSLRFFMTQEMLRPFYAAADAVLVNSGHEPFGLVGLEAMAARGVAFTGATGEEYTLGRQCAIPLDTDDPAEIAAHVVALRDDPDRSERIRREAHRQAAEFTWSSVSDILLDKIAFAARRSGLITDRLTPARRVGDIVVYTVVHQPRRLRLPASPIPESTSARQMASLMFDDEMNERYFRKVAATCYYPAVERLRRLVNRDMKLGIGFSMSFIEQAQRWDERLLSHFRALVLHDNVELVAVEPTHSFLLLWDVVRFIDRMKEGARRLESIFDTRPVVADTTEMMMSDTIYHALDAAGFRGAVMDGRPWVMNWRQPTYVYHHGPGSMKLLTRHYPLSDDVGYRFSDRSWSEWPLMADRYMSWVSGGPGDVAVLGWDFETFGEHHRVESGIFEFLDALPEEARRAGMSFLTPTEAIDTYGGESFDLPLPPFATTWAGSGGLEFFLGNDAQRAVFHLMMQAYNKALLTDDPELVDLALWLAQSDNLHLIQWFGRSGAEAEVSAYFTPHEWWRLGPEGIVWEIQQVYKNFIAALDAHLPPPTALPTNGQAEREEVAAH